MWPIYGPDSLTDQNVGSLNPNKHMIHAVIAALKARSSVRSIDKIYLPVKCKTE